MITFIVECCKGLFCETPRFLEKLLLNSRRLGKIEPKVDLPCSATKLESFQSSNMVEVASVGKGRFRSDDPFTKRLKGLRVHSKMKKFGPFRLVGFWTNFLILVGGCD